MGRTFAGLDDALAWLGTHADYERTAPRRRDVPTLEPIRVALASLGSPEADLAIVHVTGTNGKGSTTAMAAALAEAGGRRVGTYTSPDLQAVHERLAVAGVPIDDDALTSLLGRLADLEAAGGPRLTRFELLTVGSMLHFSDEGVEVAVVEVGLGGSWDATNVLDGSVAVVTNVSLDHTEVLGHTVAEIATDKAGIVKPGATAILGDTHPATVELQARLARERGAAAVWRRDHELVLRRNDVAVGGRLVSVETPLGAHEDVLVSLHGAHQGANAACAIAAVEALEGSAIPDDVVAEALGAVSVPGRLEIMSRRPLVVLDGAHNPAGATALADALTESFPVTGTIRCVIGMLSNRDPAELLGPLARGGVTVAYCCRPDSPRGLDAPAISHAALRLGLATRVAPTVSDALDAAMRDADAEDLVVVTGSFYVVGEARAHLLGLGPHRG
ncbi:MAG TPA: Mur ligase family protein [Acidimicrobiales bacterium]|nr:Mur ligase family protein [Acidimicrobiales bacterium]